MKILNMYLIAVNAIFIFFIFGCSNSQNGIATHINIDNANIADNLIVDNIISSVELIPLKNTSAESMLSEVAIKTFFYKDRIIIVDYIFGKYVSIFDDHGNFISKIKISGEGPGEFSEIRSVSINSNKNQIEIFSANEKKEVFYSLSGVFLDERSSQFIFDDKIVIDQKNQLFFAMYLANLGLFKDGNCYELFSVDEDDAINRIKPTDQQVARKLGDTRTPNPFFKYNGMVFFCKTFLDTIFSVEDEKIEPEYIIDFKERAIPNGFWQRNQKYSEKQEAVDSENFAYLMGRFFENDRFLSIIYSYNGKSTWFILDKKTQQQINSLSIRMEKYDLNFPPPFQFSEEGFFYYVSAREFKKLVQDHPNPKILPPHFKEVAEELDDDDNPVIVKVNLIDH